MISKKDLLTSVMRYMKEEVASGITDVPLRMAISAMLYTIELKPSIVDSFFMNPMIAAILPEENGMYDTSLVIDVLNKLCDEYGKIPITIPPIKFISPTEHTLTFGRNDIARLKEYLGLMEVKNG